MGSHSPYLNLPFQNIPTPMRQRNKHELDNLNELLVSCEQPLLAGLHGHVPSSSAPRRLDPIMNVTDIRRTMRQAYKVQMESGCQKKTIAKSKFNQTIDKESYSQRIVRQQTFLETAAGLAAKAKEVAELKLKEEAKFKDEAMFEERLSTYETTMD